jgi:hypothetical protein
MTKINVRGLHLGELSLDQQKEFVSWAWQARQRTTFDANIFGYPRIAMLIAENNKGATAYLPVQTTLMAESFIPNPDSTNREKALSLGRFDAALIDIAKSMNVGDVYCYVPDGEADYAEKIQSHGWEEVPNVRLFKKRTGVKITSEPTSEPC